MRLSPRQHRSTGSWVKRNEQAQAHLRHLVMSGNLIVVSAPSGGGKTSLVNAMLAEDPNLVLSISFTTRPPRPGEQDGREYHFVDPASFEAMLERGEFLECAEVHGNRYGTSQKWIEEMRACGKDVVLEIDWQGAQQVRRLYPGTTTVFILPPSMTELERRLRARAQDSDPVIRRRLENAIEEISHALEFDYVIINNTFEEARRDLAAVVRAGRLTLGQQIARNPDLLNLTGTISSR
jgi:guanylate kinase